MLGCLNEASIRFMFTVDLKLASTLTRTTQAHQLLIHGNVEQPFLHIADTFYKPYLERIEKIKYVCENKRSK